MARGGFFTRQDTKEARSSNSRAKGRVLSEQTMRKLGSSGVKKLNPWAKSPNMQPSIPEDAQVLVLGDFPTEKDDERGQHYSGKSGALLRGMIPMWAQDETAFDYILRTYPGDNAKIRPEWIGCFRGEVEKTILSMRPKVVIGLGHRVCNWMIGIPDSRAVRGKPHPVQIGDHTFWFVPTLCPRILLANEDNRLDKVPGEEYIRVVTAEIQRAYELVDSDEEPYVVPEKDRRAPITYCMTVGEVEAACRKLAKCKSIGFDTESTNLRPYWKSSELLSVAFSDGKHNYAIPLEHPKAPWTSIQLKRVKRSLLKLTESGVRLVAHNLCHDLEWWRVYLGQSVYEGEWGCSLEAAFVLDPGPPGDGSAGHSLNHVTKRLFGFAVKDLATAAMSVTRLREVELMKVLEYNAYDAEWCLKAWKRLVREVKDQGLEDAYWLQIDRIPAMVETQFIGVPIDQSVREELFAEFSKKLESVRNRISRDPDVRRFEKATNQKFNPSSNEQVAELFEKGLGRTEVRKPGGGVTTGAPVLKALGADHPIALLILEYRGVDKLIGTYVTKFEIGAKDGYVYEDGLIHCQFSIHTARTARLASQNPNNQNWPKRKNKEVRKQIKAPPGWCFLSVDQARSKLAYWLWNHATLCGFA